MDPDFLPSPDSFSEPQVLPQVSSWLHTGASVGLAGGSLSQSQPPSPPSTSLPTAPPGSETPSALSQPSLGDVLLLKKAIGWMGACCVPLLGGRIFLSILVKAVDGCS